jgi:hypothetical protein
MPPAGEVRRQAVCRISSLPMVGSPVLGADLNRSESRGRGAEPRSRRRRGQSEATAASRAASRSGRTGIGAGLVMPAPSNSGPAAAAMRCVELPKPRTGARIPAGSPGEAVGGFCGRRAVRARSARGLPLIACSRWTLPTCRGARSRPSVAAARLSGPDLLPVGPASFFV